MKSCVIIPTYNESRGISELISKIRKQNLDIIVIDDGSSDNTSHIAAESGAVVLINLKNEGKGASLRKGFDYALSKGYDAVITMDGDSQHLPEDLPYFIRLAESSNSGIIIGNRMQKTKNMPFIRLMTNEFMSWLISCVAKQSIPDSQCGYRLIKRAVLEKVRLSAKKFEIESEILIKSSRSGFKIESVPIETVYGQEKSHINPFLDTLRFIKFILRNIWSTKP